MGLQRFFSCCCWDEERARELDAHLAIEIEENLQRGMTPNDARDEARRKLGNTTLVREEIYQMNTIELVDSIWRELKHAARLLLLNPGFAIVAILSLALGVGANTAIFQLLDAVTGFSTLRVKNPEQLVENPGRQSDPTPASTGQFSGRRPSLTNPQFERVRDQQQAFTGLAAWGTATFNMSTSGEAHEAVGFGRTATFSIRSA